MMRKLLLHVLLCVTLQVWAETKPKIQFMGVDPRVECTGIVFRLAGAPEYNNSPFKVYNDEIEGHFSKFKEHEAVKYAQQLRREYGISFDAVVTFAISLDKNFDLNNKYDHRTLLSRWDLEHVKKFSKLLRQFYQDTNYQTFHLSQKRLYDEINLRFETMCRKLDVDWFDTFFATESLGSYHVVNAPVAGHANYGPSLHPKNSDLEAYSFIGAARIDSEGLPIYDESAFLILVHEFCHSFVNPHTDRNHTQFEDAGKSIFRVLGSQMKRQAYGSWESVINEAMVRSAVVQYMRDHSYSEQSIASQINYEESRGFKWVGELSNQLAIYQANREQYPTFDDFTGQVVEKYKEWGGRYKEIYDKVPKVVSIEEFENNDQDVSPATKTITVNFDKPLLGQGHSIYATDKGMAYFPKLANPQTDIKYINGNKSVQLTVTLEPNKEYECLFVGKAYKSEEGYPILNYILRFKTNAQ